MIKEIDYTFICAGDTIITPIDSIMNTSLGAVSNIELRVNIPYGVVYSANSFNRGTYTNSVLQLGTLRKNEKISGAFYWTVTDDCYPPFRFDFTVVANGNICFQSGDNRGCVIVDGLSNCKVHGFRPVKFVYSSISAIINDYTYIIDASNNPITITLPNPQNVFMSGKGGTEWHFKVINLTNPVNIVSPDGKIVNFSTPEDASQEIFFDIVGRTFYIQSVGPYYVLKLV